MKTHTQKILVLGLAVACVLGIPSLAQTAEPPVEPSAMNGPARPRIEGRITAKTNDALIVDGKDIAITTATSFIKGNKVVTADEVSVGDAVRVSVSTGRYAELQAVTVEVVAQE